MTAHSNTGGLLARTVDIVAAHVGRNPVSIEALPDFIVSVHTALNCTRPPAPALPNKRSVPAVPVRKSVTPDYLISLEDGRPYKLLKHHLRACGLTPEQYREKWGLPAHYPMVAPNYARTRSLIAKAIGLSQSSFQARKRAAGKV